MRSSSAHLNHATCSSATNKRGFMKKFSLRTRSGVIAIFIISLIAFAGFSTVIIQRTQASKTNAPVAITSAPAAQPLTIGTCDVATAGLPVEVEADAGTTGPTAYASLGAAFAAINAGTHQGNINVEICFNSNEGTTPATLNSGDATPAVYSTVSIRPLADGLTVSGNPVTGFGVVQLNGADSVTLDGDNPNTMGTNRNLTISNTTTTTVIANSAVRIATSAAVTSANNNIIRNCALLGNVTGGNSSLITSTTGSSNSSFGIYVGGNGGATATGAPTAITSVTTNVAPNGTTINNLLIDNNSVNQAARAIVFNGAVVGVSNGVTISNNTIGTAGPPSPANPPFTSPATTVYTKGIWVAGTAAVSVTGNTINNIMSFVGTTITAVEMVAPVTNSTISNNNISSIANNGTVSIVKAVLVSSSTGAYTISGNSVSNVQTLAGASGTAGIEGAATSTNSIIEKNKVTKVHGRSTGTFGAYGINVTTGTGVTLRNNFVSDINMDMTGGAAFSTQFSVFGIRLAGGTGHRVYHNSVNLFGSLFGTPNSSILTAAFCPTATTITGMDVRNNIFANTMTGGTTSIAHVSMFLPASATVAFNLTINNNDYFANATAGSAGIAHVGTTYTAVPAGPTTYAGLYTAANFNPADTTATTNLRTYTNTLSAAGTNDNASKVVDPLFSTPTDLHLIGTSPMIEMGVNVMVADDIDMQVRPNGPLPDIGADEFYPSPGTLQFSSATYAGNEGTTVPVTVNRVSGSSGTVTVDVTVSNGTATGGAMCGPGIDYVAPGIQTLTFGDTVTSQSINIQLCSDAVFDLNETINFSLSNATGGATIGTPSSAVLTITDVPPPFNGSTSVGTGQTYTSLTNPGGLFEAINLAGATGNVVIEITSDLTGESGTVPLNQLAGGFTVTIRPSGAARTITSTGTAVAVIKLNDADNVTIDGSLGGAAIGGTDRSLSIINTNTAANTTCIWVASATNGAQNNVIQNLNLEGGVNQSVTNVFNFAIISSSSASILTGGTDNDNNTYNNNFIKKVSVGIISIGGLASNMNQTTTISNNLIGPAAFGIDEVSTLGILIFNENAPNIVGNELRFIGDAATTGGSSGRDHVGISLCTGSASWAGGTAPTVVGTVTNGNISRNTIHDIIERATFSAVGIVNNCANGVNPTNNTIANNMIYNIQANGTSGDQTVGIAISNGNGDKVVHNSIYLTGDLDPGAATSSSTSSFGINVSVATPTNLTLQDNISVMDLTSNTATLFHAAINIISPTYNWGTGGSNYNNWFAGPSAQARVGATAGSGGTFHTTLASWQMATSQDANSLSVDPLFVSPTNLHIQASSPMVNAGIAVPGVTTDFDNQTRDAMPDIGADEIVPGVLELSAATYSVGESAGTVTITVNRTGGTDGAVAVNYSLSDGTATGGAACGAGVDYVNTGGTVNFTAGQTSQTFMVTICPDASPEGNETFNVMLSGATGGATIGTQSSAVVTITDDDVAMPGTLQFSAATYTTGEGAVMASIGVTRTGGSDGAVSVDYATVMGGTATGGASCMTPGVDYVTTSGTLMWANGDSSAQSFNITICNDALDEPDETVNLALSNVTGGATIGMQSTAVLTITDDDATPSISISDVSMNEGNAGTTNFVFNVNLSAASGQTVTVHYQTADGTATTADNDYVAIPDTTLTFDPGDTSKQVTVTVNGDVSVETNETFFVNLSNATNATISDNQGQGTIQNDDFILPVITISDARVLEGNSGTTTAQFTVTLTGATQGPPSVHYSTSNGTAVASPSPTPGDDYVAIPDTVLNFMPLGPNDAAPDGDGPPTLTATINVTVNGDILKEANETFYVNLSVPTNAVIGDNQGVGIIIDDDRAYTADLDHDRKSDYNVFRPSEGIWYTLQSTNGFTNYRYFGSNGDRPVPGDYDGDGTMDLAVFRDSTATWYIEQSSNFGFVQLQWGLSGDKPVQGDYDGDGKTDIGVFRNGAWYIVKSSGGVLTTTFGTTGDRAVPGDYDGDAKTDFAVFRNGDWYILRSSDSMVASQTWGLGSDQPVPADYDGDGSYDVAVFRNGAWYINQTLGGPRAVSWGTTGDIPVMADYDGDGTADIAIYRDGDWYIIRSSNGTVQTQNWGLDGDIPAASAYLPQ
jgi:hypothetical protein